MRVLRDPEGRDLLYIQLADSVLYFDGANRLVGLRLAGPGRYMKPEICEAALPFPPPEEWE